MGDFGVDTVRVGPIATILVLRRLASPKAARGGQMEWLEFRDAQYRLLMPERPAKMEANASSKAVCTTGQTYGPVSLQLALASVQTVPLGASCRFRMAGMWVVVCVWIEQCDAPMLGQWIGSGA